MGVGSFPASEFFAAGKKFSNGAPRPTATGVDYASTDQRMPRWSDWRNIVLPHPEANLSPFPLNKFDMSLGLRAFVPLYDLGSQYFHAQPRGAGNSPSVGSLQLNPMSLTAGQYADIPKVRG